MGRRSGQKRKNGREQAVAESALAEPGGGDVPQSQEELLETLVLQPLRDSYPNLTKTEKRLATLMLSRPNCLVLDTAAKIAQDAKVSPMTAGRLLRKLGFDGITDVRRRLKTDLYGPDGTSLWSMDRRYEAFTTYRATHKTLNDSLAAELAAIRAAYDATTTTTWKRSIEALTDAERVVVSGLHMARGLAVEFTSRLEYVRPGVQLADGQNGHYCEVLYESSPQDRLMVLIDFYRYDKATRRLGKMAKERGYNIMVVTDSFCAWAHEVSDKVIALPTSTGLFWHSTGALSVVLNLLVNDVIAAMGDRVPERIEEVLVAQQVFDQFSEEL